LSDVDAGVVFSRLVAEAGHDVHETALALEKDEDVLHPYTNLVAVQPGDQDSAKTQAVQEANQSPEVQEWMEDYLDCVLEYNDRETTANASEARETFTA